MVVGILEPSYHSIYLYSQLLLLRPVKGVLVFCNKQTKVEVEDFRKTNDSFFGEVKWILRKRGENIGHFLKRIEKNCKALDLLLINTIQSDYLSFVNFSPCCPSVLTIHNVNKWLNRGFFLSLNSLVRRLILRLKAGHGAESFSP